MQECSLADCAVRMDRGAMHPVHDEIDGQPIVGYACSTEHARQLVLQWTTGDRYSVPDEILRAVDGGLTTRGAA